MPGPVWSNSGSLPAQTGRAAYIHANDDSTLPFAACSAWHCCRPSVGRPGRVSRFRDNIVPLESQGVQAWDRYAYVNNNPVRYNDPSGHWVVCIGLVLVGAFFIFNGTSDSYQPNLSNTELESRQTSVAIGTSLILSGLSIKSPLVELISNGIDCASGYCDPNLMIPGSAASYNSAVTPNKTIGENIADYPSGTGFSSVYDSAMDTFEFMPSVDTLNPPSGWVQQFGGHQDVANVIIGKGSNFSDLYGFAVKSDLPDTLIIQSWNSGILNPQHGARLAPADIQTKIVSKLKSGGWNVME